MPVNPSLTPHLVHRATRYRPTESIVRGTTTTVWPSTGASTGLACNCQPLSPEEQAKAYGYDVEGTRWRAFWHSTVAVQLGDLVQQTTGPDAGTQWWVRGMRRRTDKYAEHLETALEVARETITLTASTST